MVIALALLAVLPACAHHEAVPEPAATEMPDGTWAYLLPSGAPAFPGHYQMALGFQAGGIAGVVDDTGWAIIDREGHVLLRPMVFDNGPDYFVEGLARYVSDGLVGFYDETGRIVIPARFEFARPFKDGRARVGSDCSRTTVGEHVEVDCAQWSEIDRSGRSIPTGR